MKGNPKIYLLLLGHVLLGLLLLVLINQVPLPSWFNDHVLYAAAFLLLNVLYIYKFGLKSEGKVYYSLYKLPGLLLGMALGMAIALLPALAAFIFGEEEVSFSSTYGIRSILIMFAVVSWEELLFRSIILNHAQRKLPVLPVALFMGLLFMSLHFLNPEFDVLRSGATVFLAGAFLTLIYFRFKSFWLPLGIHFGNNATAGILEDHDKHILLEENGYLTAIILAALLILFVWNHYTRRHKVSPGL